MKIANIDLGERPVMLAPMEDVTDASFRLICREQGAAMVYTEFVSAEALIRNISSTTRKLHIDDRERPVAIQIYGREADAMVEAARIVEEARPDLIDLNFGCPVKKVASKGAGAGMLRDIPKMLDITRRVVEAVKIPVTVKTRLGWDADNKIITDLGPMLQDCGIAALTVHGRTRAQMYTGSADWTLIGELKNDPRMQIPIIGNGDITTPEQAREAFERYGVDGIMIGRAAFGAPWIFRDVRDLLDGTGREPLSIADKFALLRRQVTESVERIDEYRGILHIRRHLAASPLFKGLPNFRETRIRLLRAETLDEIFSIFDEINQRFFQLSATSEVL
ncbi:MAG: tRNA dihydrouridine synthase DusB [Muribaculaceae bacterium]|nr:tRNA dihydrouridine synthase DusB [Bacteroides sp.]MDE6681774.1 tRNA dihydrouridine synthase DusB [Muribaculaceae bacterium]MDE6803012.1 tRNA dihydrouridine synthase DusB [Muribaculaceae bacterium]MDE7188903.1 tRNA dihydrouridine synthase DusB [Muribaculaceae bacterium]